MLKVICGGSGIVLLTP
nr:MULTISPECIES: hypothetical protein [Pseudoalteromonas]